jgi:DNA-binding transcriptional LysR family regulator
MTLLTRTRGGVRLTREGETLYPLIQKYVSVYRELYDRAGEFNGLESGELRIGTFSSVSQRLLPGLMSDFSLRYPGIRFILSPGDNTTLPERVRSGQIDFSFMYPEAAGDLTCLPIAKDEFRAVLPVDHPFASRPSVSLAEMAAESLIVVEEGQLNTILDTYESYPLIFVILESNHIALQFCRTHTYLIIEAYAVFLFLLAGILFFLLLLDTLKHACTRTIAVNGTALAT